MGSKDHDCLVTVTIELGHTASFLKEPSPEGFTHDWTIFVRGKDNSKIEHFVEKVVFRLHKTFKNPNRTLLHPPYKVTESGYAGFILPIEIHFKNKQSPRKICFSYDLYLNAIDHPPINNSRYELLKFWNPTPEFKAKLIKAGGIEQGTDLEPPSYAISPPPFKQEKKKSFKKSKGDSVEKKKKKKHKPPREPSPVDSLSSLSPDSSSDEESKVKHKPHLAPASQKKEKDSVKKDSQHTSSHNKSDGSFSLSQEHNKSKHKSSSQSLSSHKDRPEKDQFPKKHKSKDKDKDRHPSLHKSEKDSAKHKSKESSSHSSHHKPVIKAPEVSHDRETVVKPSPNTGSDRKNLSSGSQGHSEHKEKHSSSTLKESAVPHHKERHGSHKSKESSSSSTKNKHSSASNKEHLEHSGVSKKVELPEKKVGDKDRHEKKSHKRQAEVNYDDEVSEKKKSKTSPQSEEKSSKPKNSKNKLKDGDSRSMSKDKDHKHSKPKELPVKDKEREIVVKKETDEVKKEKREESPVKEKMFETVFKKEKRDQPSINEQHKKEKHKDKHKHNKHKSKESSHKDQVKSNSSHSGSKEIKKEKPYKSEALLKSESLAMTEAFQPKLLVSPLQSRSDSEDEDADHRAKPTSPKHRPKVKRSTSSCSASSVESLGSGHKETETLRKLSDEDIVQNPMLSGLSESESEGEKAVRASPAKRSPKPELLSPVKQKHHKPDVPSDEKKSKSDSKKKSVKSKHPKDGISRSVSDREAKGNECGEGDSTDANKCEDLKESDILAPNGISLRELMAINEKIELACEDSALLERVVYLVGETDNFDLDETSFLFDICSLEKSIVRKIQGLLKGR